MNAILCATWKTYKFYLSFESLLDFERHLSLFDNLAFKKSFFTFWGRFWSYVSNNWFKKIKKLIKNYRFQGWSSGLLIFRFNLSLFYFSIIQKLKRNLSELQIIIKRQLHREKTVIKKFLAWRYLCTNHVSQYQKDLCDLSRSEKDLFDKLCVKLANEWLSSEDFKPFFPFRIWISN